MIDPDELLQRMRNKDPAYAEAERQEVLGESVLNRLIEAFAVPPSVRRSFKRGSTQEKFDSLDDFLRAQYGMAPWCIQPRRLEFNFEDIYFRPTKSDVIAAYADMINEYGTERVVVMPFKVIKYGVFVATDPESIMKSVDRMSVILTPEIRGVYRTAIVPLDHWITYARQLLGVAV